MSLSQKLSVGGKITLGIITLAELVMLAGCTKSTPIIDQRNLSGMTVDTYADQYCGDKHKDVNSAAYYERVHVNQEVRNNGDTRYVLTATHNDGIEFDYSCNSSWIKP